MDADTGKSIFDLALITAAAFSLAPALAIGVQALAGFFAYWRGPQPSSAGAQASLLVIIPAHDEADGISETVACTRRAADGDGVRARLVVIADNCGDDTAARSRAAGAEARERCDPERRGKGQALAWAAEGLRGDAWDGLVVLDADARPQPGFFKAVAAEISAGTPAMQGYYWIEDGGDARTAMMQLAFALINGARPLGRYSLGGSAQITGNGFALSRSCFERRPFAPSSALAEDLEHGLSLVAAGIRVKPLPHARIAAASAPTKGAATSQRLRWESGRLDAIRRWWPRLVACRTWAAWESAFDLLIPPLGLVVLMLLAVAAFAAGFANQLALSLAAAGLCLLFVALLAALRVAGLPLRSLLVLRHVPLYLAWKVAIYASPGFWHQRAWVRTARARVPGETP